MRLQAKTAHGQVVAIEVQADDALDTLKDALQTATHIPNDMQKILFKGKMMMMVNGGKVSDTGIQDGDSIIVLQHRTKPPAPPPDLSREPDAAAIRAAIAKSRGVDVKVIEDEEEAEEPEDKNVNHLQELVNSLFGNLGLRMPPPVVPAAPVPANTNPPPEAIAQLTEMGFTEAQARRALIRNRMSVPQATEWLLEHGDEEEPAAEPASAPAAPGPAVVGEGGQVPTTIVPPAMGSVRAEQRLLEMGFPSEEVTRALREAGGNYEAACAILLGENDDDDSALDEDSPIVRAIFSNPIVGAGLSNPRVMQAFRAMVEDPTTVTNYINDPEVGPLILQVHSILQGLVPGRNSSAPSGTGTGAPPTNPPANP